jgi:hypothetical protein
MYGAWQTAGKVVRRDRIRRKENPGTFPDDGWGGEGDNENMGETISKGKG